jgi:two-component system, OmpR family, response regulator MprA
MPPARILVVDDEADLAAILANRLRHAGYEVTIASDGLAALEAIGRERPDLAVLDVQMPRLDGLETLRRLRASEAAGRMPVIVMTANAEPADRARALASGADECLAKPFETAELLARVRGLLGAGRDDSPARPPDGG